MVRLVLVLLLIGWKTGASLLSQSLSVACNHDHVITFDSHLKTALCTNTTFLLFFSSSRVQFSFERMPLLGWIRCLICSALLFSSNPSEPASGTQATDQHRLPVSSDETGPFLCSCRDKKGRTYNLSSLAKRDGTPRFVKKLVYFKIRDDFVERNRFQKWIRPPRRKGTSKENNTESHSM